VPAVGRYWMEILTAGRFPTTGLLSIHPGDCAARFDVVRQEFRAPKPIRRYAAALPGLHAADEDSDMSGVARESVYPGFRSAAEVQSKRRGTR